MTHDRLDRVIDEAAQEALLATPRAGLAERTLARVSTEPPASGNRLGRWAVPASIAAACVLLLSIGPLSRKTPQMRRAEGVAPALQHVAPVKPSPVAPVLLTTHGKSVIGTGTRKHLASGPTAPLFDTFPAPSPMTPEEVRLYALASQDKPLQPDDQPISIASIDIEPVPERHEILIGEKDDDQQTIAHDD